MKLKLLKNAICRVEISRFQLKGKYLKTTKIIADNLPFFDRMAVVFVFFKYFSFR
jgi:hypothetical protein